MQAFFHNLNGFEYAVFDAFILLAAGERMYSRYDFKQVLADGGLGIIQPDLSHAGGITECIKIASMAEAYDVGLAPHFPLGPLPKPGLGVIIDE